MRNRHASQRGFSMIVAVFLLVVLGALGAAMANLSVIQHTGLARDVQGARAYQAARAGIEWALYRSLVSSACAASASFVLPAQTLQSFTVTVTCTESATTPVMRQFVVTACNEPDGGNCPNANPTGEYVERKLQATIEKPQ
jgi:MSHA biogenesis protein MshP